jgi:predicted helicase
LFGLFSTFQKNVFSELKIEEFADAFAQMLAYGLFLAKLNSGKQTVTLTNAKTFIPQSFELIRELVTFLDELENKDYQEVKWIVIEILSMMNNLDLGVLHEDLSFTKTERSLWKEMDEEKQLLFKKDPYVYFYEDFLSKYDPAMRKAKGVYYTPPPVVNFIVRAINDVLKEDFGIKDGFADHERVTVLDFATGTGTFLLQTFEQMLDELPEGSGKVQTLIREHILKNFYGFEYLIAPYTIAHLKLSQYLKDKGYVLKDKERLQFYLTNTLEPVEPQINFLLPALSQEGKKAQAIKEQPILVITGNPPYNVKSKNNGKWIEKLVEDDYYKVDGKPLGERNPKNLKDDYVKFIRFAQHKMEQVEKGVVGIITNHAYLSNPTFRGMRQSLMRTFNQIYILDLHGNAKKKEKCPDGSKDENVFDIEQGVAIALFIKHPKLKQKIVHADFWGKRKEKYLNCYDQKLSSISWKNVQATSPFYFYYPQNANLLNECKSSWKVLDIFKFYKTGCQTGNDDLFVAFEKEILEKIKADIQSLEKDEFFKKYNFKPNQGWGFESKYLSFKGEIESYLYKPFDTRYVLYGNILRRRANEVLSHFIKENMGLCLTRQFSVIGEDIFEAVIVFERLIEHNIFRRGGNLLFPLYLYRSEEDQKKKKHDLFENDEWDGKDKIENLSQSFREFIDQKYAHHYTPEEVLSYIYAILHSPTYRIKYAEFLKSDFPRIPFVDDRKTFEQLSKFGSALIQSHLIKTIPDYSFGVFKGKGSNEVEKPSYTADRRVYINKDQYFHDVPQSVWEFHIGGYQVIDKYLKSRKGRTLSLDEITHVEKIVKILAFTIDQMKKIDGVWKP